MAQLSIIKQMSRQVSRGSTVDYQADEQAGWAQQPWHTGFVPPRHVESSWTRDQTHSPLNGQADSAPLDHQGSPSVCFL